MKQSNRSPDQLLALLNQDANGLSTNKALAWLAEVINLASRLTDLNALEVAINVGSRLLEKDLSDLARIHVLYFLANAHNARRLVHGSQAPALKRMQVPDAEQELRLLRHSARLLGEKDIPTVVQCRVLTNLGNVLSFLGRPIEAIQQFDRALFFDSDFQMARGNRAFCLLHYGMALPLPQQRRIIIKAAYDGLREALRGELEDHAREGFAKTVEQCQSRFSSEYLDHTHTHPPQPLGRGNSERSYRKWCLTSKLFLDPLNDLGVEHSEARDSLSLPSITMSVNEGPFFHGRFNQLKQEYASARYLFYEGLNRRSTHFSDRGVTLANTMIYPVYGLSAEMMRLSFRACYSVLDKIAVFLNSYLKLGIPPHQVDFSSLWFEGRKRSDIRQALDSSANWPMRGLFWLSRDLYDKDSTGEALLDPDTRAINTARNHLEHRYLVLLEMKAPKPKESPHDLNLIDPEALYLSRAEFSDLALRLLRIARSSLIYLSMAIAWEERTGKKNHVAGKKVPAIHLDHYEDSWKR